MNTIYAPAFAAFGGSAFGAISTIVTGWVTRRRRLRERHYSRSISKRERLYRSFIEEASRVYADALVSDKSEIPRAISATVVFLNPILRCNRIAACTIR